MLYQLSPFYWSPSYLSDLIKLILDPLIFLLLKLYPSLLKLSKERYSRCIIERRAALVIFHELDCLLMRFFSFLFYFLHVFMEFPALFFNLLLFLFFLLCKRSISRFFVI